MQPLDLHPKLRRVDELDGIRGIPALWVAVTRILCWCGFAVDPPHAFETNPWYQFIFAAPAVDVFIILSGFAISFLLHSREQSYGSFMRGAGCQ
jgi:peptidoglycan/LPS O-acetylase OafA/YrhL